MVLGVSVHLQLLLNNSTMKKDWSRPTNLAPYQVHLIPINMKDEAQAALAEDLYNDLKAQGMEVLNG